MIWVHGIFYMNKEIEILGKKFKVHVYLSIYQTSN